MLRCHRTFEAKVDLLDSTTDSELVVQNSCHLRMILPSSSNDYDVYNGCSTDFEDERLSLV